MALIRRGDFLAAGVRKPEGGFTGDADQRPILAQLDPNPVRVSFVRFQPAATTHWHSHGGGQALHVVEGEGRAQNRGEETVELHVGDTVTIGPGEEHWHGAAAGSSMTHLAVTIGEVIWKEPPG